MGLHTCYWADFLGSRNNFGPLSGPFYGPTYKLLGQIMGLHTRYWASLWPCIHVIGPTYGSVYTFLGQIMGLHTRFGPTYGPLYTLLGLLMGLHRSYWDLLGLFHVFGPVLRRYWAGFLGLHTLLLGRFLGPFSLYWANIWACIHLIGPTFWACFISWHMGLPTSYWANFWAV